MDDRTERTSGATYYRLTAAAQLAGLPPSRVRRYVSVGLVRTVPDERGAPMLSGTELARLRKIRRLSSDLGLNAPGVEVALRLLDEIASLRAGIEVPRSLAGDNIFGLLGTGEPARRDQR